MPSPLTVVAPEAAAAKAVAGSRRKPAPAGPGKSGGGKVIMAEFVTCFVVLGLGTVVAPQGSKDGVPRLISRGSGLCLLFFILALMATAGAGAKRAANGLGGLVTVAYLVTSTDARNVLKWISGFYSSAGVTPTSEGYIAEKLGTSTLGGGGQGAEKVVDVGPLGTAGERTVGSDIGTGVGG